MTDLSTHAATKSRAQQIQSPLNAPFFVWMLVSLLTASSPLLAQNSICTGANQVGGIVFNDYNANGIQDPFETGLLGVTVMAYGANGSLLGTTTTNADGEYAINAINGTAVRIEFTDLPNGFSLSPASSGAGSTVVSLISPDCNVNLGTFAPNDFCGENPLIVVPCYVNGDPLQNGNTANLDVLVSFPYNSEGTEPMPDHLALGSELGAVWGLAYHPPAQKLFSAAFVKRFMGLGTLGTGGLYVTDVSTTPATNTPFIDLQALGVNTGAVGPRDLPANIGSASRDENAFDAVGKVGLGDLDISGDGNTLWVTNLAERQLVRIDISNYIANNILPTAANVQTYNIPNPNCGNGDYRPFGLKMNAGMVYVGVICSGETSGNRSDLNATVYAFDPNNPGFNNEVSFSLDYVKGALTNFNFGNNCANWEPWTSDYNDFYHTNLPNGICYPQPVLSDIEFDVDGSMILGFMDRSGHQLGRVNLPPDNSSNNLGTGTAGGDLIRVANVGGTWVVENNGVAGGVQGCGSNTGEGIGGGEFYCDDSGAGGEREAMMGSLAFLKGSGEIVHAVLNPFQTNSGGVACGSNVDGKSSRRYEIYSDAPGMLGKAHGIGDIELLCDLAPIEIAHFVWLDENNNGIQDPGEPPLEGVSVVLYDPTTGAPIATATTDENGNVFFNEDNVIGGIQPNTPYIITLNPNQYLPTVGLTLNNTPVGPIATPNVGSTNNPEGTDSDLVPDGNSGIPAIDATNLPYVQITTGNYGESVDNVDIGFIELEDVPCPDFLVDIDIRPSQTFCSGEQVTVRIEHLPNVGPLEVLFNVGSILTGLELYEGDNGGADVIQEVFEPAPNTTVSTFIYTFPENNTGAPFPYNIYAILDETNPNREPGCLPVVQVGVTVNPNPDVVITGDDLICTGDNATLTANGSDDVTTYQWNTGQNTPSITVNPTQTTTYSVTVTNQYGCTETDEFTVTVTAANAEAGDDQTICDGQSATLTATGGVAYEWNTGQTTATITVNPTQTTTYTVTVTDENGCMDTDQVTVTIGTADADAGPDQTICMDDNATLNATGGVTYQWNTGQTTASITVNPTTTTTYTVTVTDSEGCTDTDQVTVFVSQPTVDAGDDDTICLGESATLAATGSAGIVSYEWNTGQTTATITVNPTTTTTYTVTATDGNNCTATDQVTITVSEAVADAGPDQNVCNGAPATLTASGGVSYQWNTGQTTAQITVNPTTTTTYTVTVTDENGCTDTDQVTVTVNEANINAGDDQTICLGDNTTLTATGGVSYEWNTGQTTAQITVNPSTTTTYTVTATDINGCVGTDEITVFVNNPSVTATGESTICLGESATLTATGSAGIVSYEWNTGQTTAQITVNPTTTTTYTVTATDGNNCTATDQVTITVSEVDANAGPDQSICDGGSTTLTATGGVSYQWNTGQTTAQITVNPTATTTYIVTVTNADNCTDTDEVTVTVNEAIAEAGDNQTICDGDNATLTATGGVSYEWNTGQTTASITVNPTTTTTYTVTVTDSEGCTDTDQVTVFVSQPTVDAGDDDTICLGESTTLTATGSAGIVSYEWNTGQTTATITVNPTTTTTYTVTATDGNNCTTTDQVTITVSEAVADAGPDQQICNGDPATLTATGGVSYQWNTGQTTAQITVNPTATTTYTVTVTDENGCTDTDQVTVTINDANIDAGDDTTICLGDNATLTASGGLSYQWNTGQTTATITVNPTTTTTYTVTATDINGCEGTDQVTVFVNNPTVSIDGDDLICSGETTTLTATGSAGIVSYEWNTGQTTAQITVNPSATTTYTVTATDGLGCEATASITVTVSEVNADAGEDQNICNGDNATLTATGGVSYQWNTGQTTATITVNPTTTTTYTVTVTNGDNCTATDQVTINVNEAIAEAGPNQTICNGDNATLTASGGGTYQWNTGQTTAQITVNPPTTTTYTVTVTDGNGCMDTDDVTVFVNDPTVSITPSPDNTICLGESVELTATGSAGIVSYEWNTGQTTPSITVNPNTTTDYTVTATDGNGCTAMATITITVSIPVVEVGPDQEICTGESTSITATSPTAVSYLWNTGQTTASITVNPTTTTTYSVTVTDENGCTATDQMTVTINDAMADAGPDQTICMGENATLTATGGVSYEWNTGQTTATITVNPTTTTTYSVTVTDENGCMDTDDVTVFVNDPTVSITPSPDNTICLGESVELTATGSAGIVSYEWNTGQTTASITVNPNTTTDYTVTATDGNGCTAMATITITVSIPVVEVGPDQEICTGESTSITATSPTAVSYLWNTGQTTATITVNPTTTTTYSVTVTDENGCTATDQMTVTVNEAMADAGPDQTICMGENATLTATGGVSYEWNTGQTTATITVNPTTTTTYSVTVTDENGCMDTDDVTVFVNEPTVSITPSPDNTICLGESVELTATGSAGIVSYEWNTGQTTASITVNPNTTTDYTVTATDGNGCTATATITITVSIPVVEVGPDQEICTGESTSITATSPTAVSYLWNTGQTTATITVNPTTTTTYSVTVTDENGCTATDQMTVTVNEAMADAGPDQTICMGDNATLTATGGVSYAWNTGQTTPSITVNPTTTTTYTVTVTDENGCMDTDEVTVFVNDPTVSIDPSPSTEICLGESATLTAAGSAGIVSYEWNTGQTTAQITVNPTATTTYTVTATDGFGCQTTAQVTVIVNEAEADAGPDQTICEGICVELTASGGISYQWNTGDNTETISVTPTQTTTYTVTVTDENGCTATDDVTVFVGNADADAGQDQTICEGGTATLTATGGSSYQWNTGQNTAAINVNPMVTTTYTVTVTADNGCTAVDDVTVIVTPQPNANAGTDQVVCLGETATVTATGGSSYQWNTGETTASISATLPAGCHTYSVTVSNGAGCTDVDEVHIIVSEATADAGANQAICDGQNATLNATGGTNFNWSTGQTSSNVTVNPAVTTAYQVTVTDANGCTDTDQVTVVVGSVTADAGPDQIACPNECVSLTASGGDNYIWSTGHTTSSISVTPNSTTTYSVTVTDVSGTCVAVDQVTVSIGDDCGDPGQSAIEAIDDNRVTNKDTPIAIDVIDNDVFDAGMTVEIMETTNPLNGTVSIVNGMVQYTPNTGFVGTDQFTYQICTPEGTCDVATVIVQVRETIENCDPRITLCTQSLKPEIICPVFCNIPNDNVMINAAHTTFNCSITILDNGCLRYVALPLFAGSDVMRIVGCTPEGVCDTVYVDIEVGGNCDTDGGIDGFGAIDATDDSPTKDVVEQALQPLTVQGKAHNLDIVSISPIPSDEFIFVSFTASQAGKVALQVFDLFGKQAHVQDVQAQQGMNVVRINVTRYAIGSYVVKLTDGADTVNGKLMKD